MKSLGKIILYLIATVVLGALLAAPLYWGGQWLASQGILTWLADTAFRKFFHRGLLIAAIVLLWPTARWLKIPNVRALGIEPNPCPWRDAATGFAAAFLMMAVLAATLLTLGVVTFKESVPPFAFVKIAVSAGTVSFLEEWLFRGAILGLLARAMPPYAALFASSALFSILHFLKPDTAPFTQPVGWLSAFSLIPGAFAQFSQPWVVLGGFTTLFFVGWILGWARLQTRSLWMSIGIHAGLVLGIMSFSKATRRLMSVEETLPWFGGDLKVGLGSVAVVLMMSGIIWLALRRRR